MPLAAAAAPLHVAEEVAVGRDDDRRVWRRARCRRRASSGRTRRIPDRGHRRAAKMRARSASPSPRRRSDSCCAVARMMAASRCAFGADAAGDLLALRAHALVDTLLRLRRQIGLADADVDDAHAEFGGGGGVQVVLDRLHERGAAAGDDVVRGRRAERAAHGGFGEGFETRCAALFRQRALIEAARIV